MKKIIIALAAVAALAACSKSNVEYTPTDEISFAPVAKNMTKSMMTGTSFETTESFNVWAWYNQVGAGTAATAWNAGTAKYYFEEGTFVYREGTNWGGATPYYWPKVGSLLFAGYYPVDAADYATYTFDGTTNQMVFTDYPQSEVDTRGFTEDLMYFNMTKVSYNKGPVAVVFKHALSWVTVNLSRPSENPVDEKTGEPSEYPKITVNSVTFTNVNPQGTGTVAGTDGTIEWVVNGEVAPTVVTSEGGVILTATAQKQKEPLFIPQTFTIDDETTTDKNEAMELQINYTIASSATESFTETYSVPLAGMNGTQGETSVVVNAWEPAKHYIYNISIDIEEILIAPTVADWEAVEIPVEVK